VPYNRSLALFGSRRIFKSGLLNRKDKLPGGKTTSIGIYLEKLYPLATTLMAIYHGKVFDVIQLQERIST